MKAVTKKAVRQSREEKKVKAAMRKGPQIISQAKTVDLNRKATGKSAKQLYGRAATKPVDVHEDKARKTKIRPKTKWVPPDPRTDRLDPDLKAIRDGKAKVIDLVAQMNDRAQYYFNVFYPHFYDKNKLEVVPEEKQLVKGIAKNDKLLDAQVRSDFAVLGGNNPEIEFQYRTPKDSRESWKAYKHVPAKKGKK
jgi:hypothetical protein